MPRVAGIDIPENKPVRIALQRIYGIGSRFATDICREAGVDGHARAHTLSDDDLARINQIIDDNYAVEGVLRRQVQQNIGRLRDIRCYRGERHRRSLPVRGQSTRTNAKNRKGRRGAVGGRKGA